MKAIGYIRVSTTKQEIGPEVQRQAIEAKGKELGLPLEIYEDHAMSGADPLRIELRKAIDKLTEGDVLIVYCLDRLARDLMFQLITEREITDKGARLLSCKDEGTSSDSAEAHLLRRIVGAFAEYERIRIKERTRAAAKQFKKEGKIWGRAEYGFKRGPDGKPLADPHEQQVIRQVKLLRGQGMSFNKIVQTLNENKVQTRKGKPWRYTQVYNIAN